MRIQSINNNVFRGLSYTEPESFQPLTDIGIDLEDTLETDEDSIQETETDETAGEEEGIPIEEKVLEAELSRQAMEIKMKLLLENAVYDDFGRLVVQQPYMRSEVADEKAQREYLENIKRKIDVIA